MMMGMGFKIILSHRFQYWICEDIKVDYYLCWPWIVSNVSVVASSTLHQDLDLDEAL